MFFNSFIFFIFLAIVLPVFFVLKGQRAKSVWLLVASYVFYGYWDWRFCSLLAISTLVDFWVGQRLHDSTSVVARKRYLFLSMLINLGFLGIFKYFNFFIGSIDEIVQGFGGQVDYLHLNVILPVGISFYTFQTMSYTIDIYRKRLKPTESIIDFALFVSFFPQLVAGPIERARNLLPQIAVLRNPSKEDAASGLALIVNGFFRKVLIGDTAGRIVDHVFTEPEHFRSPELLAGLILFSIQIYADFSGYSHIARGLAKLLGIDLMKNFEQPYLACNITEFWRRWHISLSSWLRDYLYYTLGGNRISNGRTYINLMLTMLIGGLWHGASWNFVVWGGLHGTYLAIHKYALGDKKILDSFSYTGIRSLLGYLPGLVITNVLVLFAWLFFRADTFGQAYYFLNQFVNWEGSVLTSRWIGITVTFLTVVLALDVIEYRLGKHDVLRWVRPHSLAWGIGLAVMLAVVLYMSTAVPLPFVYFQF